MHLFIDTLSAPSYIALLDEKRTVITEKYADLRHKEFEDLPEILESIMETCHITYSDLQGIIVVVGPGSFTGTRVTCLIVNTIAMSCGVQLFAIDYFEMLRMQGAPLPYLLQANKREARVLMNTETNSELLPLTELTTGEYHGYGDAELFEQYGVCLYTDRDYGRILGDFSLSQPTDQARPIYIKDPNITLRKPHAGFIR